MSLCDDLSDTALKNVSACVEGAIQQQQSGRTLSSIGSGASQDTAGSYVEIGMIPVQIAAHHHTSGGTLASTRLLGAQAAPAARAARLIGGFKIGVSEFQPAIGSTSSAFRGSEVVVVSRQ